MVACTRIRTWRRVIPRSPGVGCKDRRIRSAVGLALATRSADASRRGPIDPARGRVDSQGGITRNGCVERSRGVGPTVRGGLGRTCRRAPKTHARWPETLRGDCGPRDAASGRLGVSESDVNYRTARTRRCLSARNILVDVLLDTRETVAFSTRHTPTALTRAAPLALVFRPEAHFARQPRLVSSLVAAWASSPKIRTMGAAPETRRNPSPPRRDPR